MLLEGEVKTSLADSATLNAALQSLPAWSGMRDDDSPSLRWFKTIVDALATLTRVAITLGMTAMLGYLAYLFVQSMPQTLSIPDSVQGDIVVFVLRGLIETALLAVSFWFGARGTQLKQQSPHQQ